MAGRPRRTTEGTGFPDSAAAFQDVRRILNPEPEQLDLGDFEILAVYALVFGLLVKIVRLNMKRGHQEGW